VGEFVSTAATAGAWVRQRLASFPATSRVLLKLASPCEAPSYEPAALVGNLACALVKLDHATCDDGSRTKREIDDEADAARDTARAAFADVRETRRALDAAPRGKRWSGEAGHVIPLGGRLGFVALEGELALALPWLALTELHGLGSHVAFGLGQTSIQPAT